MRKFSVAGALMLAALVSSTQAQFEYKIESGALTITRYTGSDGVVSIPESLDGLAVTRIAAGAFHGRTPVTSITIPVGVAILENSPFDSALGAFTGCPGLAAIEVDPANKIYSTVDGVLFNKARTVLLACPPAKSGSYSMPETVVRIADGAFSGCAQLTGVTISSRVNLLGERAFFGCRSLTSITLPRISRIGDGAFADCVSLTNVVISDGLTQIGDGAFSGCVGLLSMLLRESVITIGAWAFSGCERLEAIALPSKVASVGNRAFHACDRLLAITVDPDNKDYGSVDGVLFDKTLTTLVAFPRGRAGPYAIPETVTDIQDGAFSACARLSSLHIPEGVTRIPDGVFAGCGGLDHVTFPGSLTRVGYAAFYMCGELADLTFPATLSQIGDGAFYDCQNLKEVYFEGNAPTAAGGGHSRLYFEGLSTTFYHLPEATGWSSWGGRRLPWKPRMSAFRMAPENNSFAFSVTWARNKKVAVEASDNLSHPAWSPVGILTLDANTLEFHHSPSSPNRFYRLHEVPEN